LLFPLSDEALETLEEALKSEAISPVMNEEGRHRSPPPTHGQREESSSTESSESDLGLEKRHCCCCVRLADGVLLVGLYGCALHAGLLAAQASASWRGPTPPPNAVHADTDVALAFAQAIAHVVGIIVNLFLGESSLFEGFFVVTIAMTVYF